MLKELFLEIFNMFNNCKTPLTSNDMKNIPLIDDLVENRIIMDFWETCISRPEQGFWITKWKIRIKMAIQCLKWKADAVRFYNQ